MKKILMYHDNIGNFPSIPIEGQKSRTVENRLEWNLPKIENHPFPSFLLLFNAIQVIGLPVPNWIEYCCPSFNDM